ncbi:hypothetical protein [Streptomyces canus]|nr:hypothetical protein [Streptomyces canus]MDQ1071807.1 hypothetical protein [Streptomyces canus]
MVPTSCSTWRTAAAAVRCADFASAPRASAGRAPRTCALGEQGENKNLVAVAEDPAIGRPLTETEVSYVHLADADLAAVSAPVVLPELIVRADLEPGLGCTPWKPHSARRPPAPSRPPRPSTSPRNPPRPAHPGPNSRFRR